MKYPILYMIAIFAFCAFASCNEKVSQEELIETALALKIYQWREAQLSECRRKAMEKAEAYVDSILIVYSLPSKLDTIPKPPKPVKPHKPAFKPKPDSVVVEELKKGEG